MKKLAIVNHNLGSGGAEKLIYDMALELHTKKIEFSVILLTSVNCIYGKKLLEKGVDVKYLSDKWDIYSPKNILRLTKILKDYDVVHTHIYSAQLWTAFSSYFLKNKKYITTEHNTSNNRRDKKIFKFLDKWMYSRYSTIVSISQATEKKLLEWLEELKNNKFKVINNGINLKKYINTKKIDRALINSKLKETDILLCMVGRFSEQKDHKTLIEALSNFSEDVKLLLMGEGNNTQIKEYTEKLNLKERVFFLGYRSDVAEIVKSCDINILSSKWEGFGLAALESMALKIPTIGSNVEGLKEILENGGIIFEVGNSESLKCNIKKLLEDKKFYKHISQLGEEKSQEYSFEKMFYNYFDIYKENL